MKRINKYLFLDGVLNSVSWYREEWNKDHVYPQGDFDPKCVDIINDIVSKTDSNLQSVLLGEQILTYNQYLTKLG